VQVYLDLVIEPLAEARQKATALRSDYVRTETDLSVPQALVTRPTALGILGFTAARSESGVHPVAIDAGKGCVAPSSESVTGGEYALARTLYFYVNADRARENPTLRAFVDASLSDGAVASVAEAGAIALSPGTLAAARRGWEQR
jgi:phosphate transport system substrate-binding protein